VMRKWSEFIDRLRLAMAPPSFVIVT
jgi:hypothetical protein